MATAVITGGSSGIGLLFAKELASRGFDLVLVARDRERLSRVCRDLSSRYRIKAHPISVNLASQDSVTALCKLIERIDNLAYMINNAGFATHIDASDSSFESQRLQRDAVNVMALNTLLFSSSAATSMKRRRRGHIINISSISAWTFSGNYSAIKSYVLTYTEGLAISLEGSGVTATAVCPAWMHTGFHSSANLKEPSIPEWLYVKPDVVVKQALAGAENGYRVVIPTWRWKIIVAILSKLPIGVRRFITRKYMSTGNYSNNKNSNKEDILPVAVKKSHRAKTTSARLQHNNLYYRGSSNQRSRNHSRW